MDNVAGLTDELRSSALPIFVRLRELLRARGIEPSVSALAELFTDDGSLEFGIVVTPDGRVFQFDYDYLGRDIGAGELSTFRDLTSTWQASPYDKQVKAARIYLAAP